MTVTRLTLPNEWQLLPLSEVVDIRLSNVDKKLSSNEHSVFLCNYLEVYNNEYIGNGLRFSEGTATPAEIARFGLKEGDVIITKDSETREDIAKAAVVTENISRLVCGYHLAVLRPNRQWVVGRYLKESLQVPEVRAQFINGANGVTRYGLTQSVIQNALVPVPPLPEQRQIAAILGTWDEAIRLTADLIAAKQQRKKGLMQRLLSGEVRFPGFEGRAWREFALKDICLSMESGGTPSRSVAEFWQGTIPWITGADFGELKVAQVRRYISASAVEGSATKVIPKGGLLLVTRTGVGKLAVAPFEIAISQDITGLIPDTKLVRADYLVYALAWTVPELSRFNQGTSINGVTRKALESHALKLPSLQEQAKLSTLFAACDQELDLLQQKLAALQQQKKGLMQQLLTGRVRVKTTDDG